MRNFGMSDVGRQRESNQDSFSYILFDEKDCFVVVCDGMGGQNAGDVASTMVKNFFYEKMNKFFKSCETIEEIKNLILDCFNEINGRIYEKSLNFEEYKGMGTTCVVVVVKDLNLLVFNVGDSRAYLNFKDDFSQITVDHSYVQILLDFGKISKKEAKIHPRRNEITKAVGIFEKINVDYKIFNLYKNSEILVCTDGLTNSCSDEEIKKIVNEEAAIKNKVKKLVDVANNNGGQDNITIVLIKI